MLILSRKVNEKLFIEGGRIVVTLIEIRGDKVQLGIEAPADVAIDRGEIHERKQRESAALP